jgi:hypothetical protein
MFAFGSIASRQLLGDVGADGRASQNRLEAIGCGGPQLMTKAAM